MSVERYQLPLLILHQPPRPNSVFISLKSRTQSVPCLSLLKSATEGSALCCKPYLPWIRSYKFLIDLTAAWLLCWLVECLIIWLSFKHSAASFAFTDLLLMSVSHYLFWRSCVESTRHSQCRYVFSLCAKLGGHFSGFSRGISFVTFWLAEAAWVIGSS